MSLDFQMADNPTKAVYDNYFPFPFFKNLYKELTFTVIYSKNGINRCVAFTPYL